MTRSTTVTVTEFARNFSRFIHRVAYARERFVLIKGGRPVAEVSPPPRGLRLGELSQLLAELPHLSAEDAGAFADDLRTARAELDRTHTGDPWES